MTCIVGWKDDEGEVFVAADNRVTWRYFHTGDEVHVDDIQKIYFAQPFLALAFATDDLREVQSLFDDITMMAGAASRGGKLDEPAEFIKCQGSIERMLHNRKATTETITEFLVVFALPERPELTKLYYCRYSNHELKKFVDIQNNEYVVGGSVSGEAEHKRFREEVVEKSLYTKGAAMIHRVGFFNSLYLNFQDTLKDEWKTVGQSFCSLYTTEGRFAWAENERTLSLCRDGVKGDFSVQWSIVDGRCIQVQRNHLTDEEIPLVQIDKYDFSVPSKDEHRFQILASR